MFNRYPFVKQEGYKDCGCACLLMILKYYKGNMSLEALRNITKTGKSGTTAYNLVEGAREIGFSSKGFECSLNNLNDIILPCIAHVIIDNTYKHYIVIYHVNLKKREITIGDPAKGIKKLSFEKFNQIWTGVVIILYPVSSLPFTKNISIGQFVYKNIYKHKKEIIYLLLLSFFVILLKLICSFYFKFVIEGIELSKNYLRSIFLIFSILTIMKILFNYLRNKFLIILNCKFDFDITLDAFKRIISLPYCYYHNRTTGEVVSKINDLSCVRDILSKICLLLFIDIPLLLIASIFLISINGYLFLIILMVLVLYVLITFLYRKVYIKYINKIKNQKELINSYMYESISGFETVKGINVENIIIDKFNNKYIKYLNNIFLLENHINNQSFLKDFINDFGNLVILFVGSLFVYDGNLNLGYLINYSSLMMYFLEPVRNLIDMDVDFKGSKEAIARIISLYEEDEDKGIINFRNGNIYFNNLSFSFDNKKNVLKNINLNINQGEKIMICGTSGSGKSTMLKLIMKYYKVNRGMISIDGVDINDYKVDDLRKKITYISQTEVIFNDTLLNNLKFYNDDNNDVISMTNMIEFDDILDNNLGLNMLIEENGSNLSGGQRQRIVLARSLLKNSDIILIDEGLNQIDVSLERKILSNVFDKFHDKTILIISHRIENLDLYDRIIKLSDGLIVKDDFVE